MGLRSGDIDRTSPETILNMVISYSIQKDAEVTLTEQQVEVNGNRLQVGAIDTPIEML